MAATQFQNTLVLQKIDSTKKLWKMILEENIPEINATESVHTTTV